MSETVDDIARRIAEKIADDSTNATSSVFRALSPRTLSEMRRVSIEKTAPIVASELAPLLQRAEAAEREREELRGAIRSAGFAVMETSGDWNIYDVSEKGKAADAKSLQVANENVELSLAVERLRTACQPLLDICERHSFFPVEREILSNALGAGTKEVRR